MGSDPAPNSTLSDSFLASNNIMTPSNQPTAYSTNTPYTPGPMLTNYGYHRESARNTPGYRSQQTGLLHSEGQQLQSQGYQIGQLSNDSPETEGFQQVASKENPLETQAQRYINMQRGYAWGGDPLAAQRASQAAFATGQNYGDLLKQTSGYAMGMGQENANRIAPTTDYTQAQQSRAGQMAAYQGIMDQANNPQSAAQAQLQSGNNLAMANALALARSGRGEGESAAGMQQAMWSNAATSQQNANAAAQLRAQEQQQRIGAYQAAGQMAGQMRGGDTGQAQYLTDTQLKNRQLNDVSGLGYTQLAMQGQQAASSAQLGYQQLGSNINTAALQGTEDYEANLTNLYNGAPTTPGHHNYTGEIVGAGVGAVGGFFVGGVPGAVGGAEAGYKIGQSYDQNNATAPQRQSGI